MGLRVSLAFSPFLHVGYVVLAMPYQTSLPMRCGEKTRLLSEYCAATDAFLTAVQELRKRIGTSPGEEHQRLERITLEARMKSEQARLALEQHVVTHGC